MKTFACIGSGPSLTQDDVDLLRGRATVIAINDAYRLAPWAHALYACDAKWWNYHQGVPSFAGKKYALECGLAPVTWPDVTVLKNSGVYGLGQPGTLRSGFNSGYQALNLAVNLGASRVILLGYDMQNDPDGRRHWFGRHPAAIEDPGERDPYYLWIDAFESIRLPLIQAGVDVVNCSRRSALKTFPMVPLEDALAAEVLQ